jgi:hypothetical protein
MADDPAYHTQRWSKPFEDIDLETGQLAKICQVPLLDPGVIERAAQRQPRLRPLEPARLRQAAKAADDALLGP